MHRLFVALRPPALIRDQLIDLMGGVPGARWQDDEQLHVTLRFIGEVERPVAEDIVSALGSIVFPALTVRLDGVGRFEGRPEARALWAGLAPHDALGALHRKIDHALIRAGLTGEPRAYLPHITLARLPRTAGPPDAFLARHAGLTSDPFTLTHFALYESRLAREGARYDAIARWPLSGSAAGPASNP